MSLVVVLSVTAVLVVASRSLPLWPTLVPATVRAHRRQEASRGLTPAELLMHAAVRLGPDDPPRSKRAFRARGFRDPLEKHRAIVGPEAHTPWYIRVRAIILLVLIVAGIGAAIAGFLLLLIASGRFLLELLAS